MFDMEAVRAAYAKDAVLFSEYFSERIRLCGISIICQGELKDTTTTHVSNFGTRVLFINDVPCQKCTQCGEALYNMKVGMRVERIADAFRETTETVATVSYTSAA